MNETERLSTRMHLIWRLSELQAIDKWRGQQPDLPTRTEAIWRPIQIGLKTKAPASKRQ